jgi:glycosyltransferase involved in cell wall biosynthesis
VKILHVVDAISQTRHGGSAVVPFQLAQSQARLGHEVTIYTTDYQAHNQKAPEDVRLVKYHCLINLLGGLRIAPGMFFAEYKFDIIHLHNYRTIVNLMAVFPINHHVPFIIQAHGNAAPINKSKIKWLMNPVWRNMLMSRASKAIADAGTEIQHYLIEGAPPKKIIEIPVGIDLCEYEGLPVRQKHDAKTILFLGRLHENKGLDLLIKAFRLLMVDKVDARLVIAGPDYGHEAYCRKLVKDLGIEDRVDWLGLVHGRDKVNLYTQADVYVMPSRVETWGLTFMEALATGTPVIMTENCGSASSLPGICGNAVPFNERDLYVSIAGMLRDNFADYYRDMRIAWVTQFGWDSIAKRTIDLYEEVLLRKCLA